MKKILVGMLALLFFGCSVSDLTPEQHKAMEEYQKSERMESLIPDGPGSGEVEEWLCGGNKLKECIREHRDAGWKLVSIKKGPAHFPFEPLYTIQFQKP